MWWPSGACAATAGSDPAGIDEAMSTSKELKAAFAAERSSRAKYRRLKNGHGTGEGLRVISGDGCWCGEPFGHDWPGKSDGEPHPKETKR